MVAAITDVEKIVARECVPIRCEAPQADLLLVEWLNAVLYEMATRHMIFGRFSVSIENRKLSAMAWGERLSLERHRPAAEVKGATYTALEVSRHCDGQWHAQCVVDV